MEREQLEKLFNKGLITEVNNIEDLLGMSERELIDKGFVTQIAILDGKDDTIEVTVIPTPTIQSIDIKIQVDEPKKEPEIELKKEPEIELKKEPEIEPDLAPEVDNGEDIKTSTIEE